MKATFAGGCFWCSQQEFEQLEGVSNVLAGYAGGTEEDATYTKVCSDTTDHAEAVQLEYNPKKISYEKLLEVFFGHINPTDAGGQFFDRGSHYRTVIFYHNAAQKNAAEKYKKAIASDYDEPIATAIEQYTSFFPAEEEHQQFYKKCPVRYKLYKMGSRGR